MTYNQQTARNVTSTPSLEVLHETWRAKTIASATSVTCVQTQAIELDSPNPIECRSAQLVASNEPSTH